MIENFDIRDNIWNLTYLHYSTYTNILMKIADFFDLRLSIPVSQVST